MSQIFGKGFRKIKERYKKEKKNYSERKIKQTERKKNKILNAKKAKV